MVIRDWLTIGNIIIWLWPMLITTIPHLKTNNPTLTQQRPYLEGRGNIKTYTAIPRPIVYTGVNAAYGDGAAVTRLSGVGVGGNLLDMEGDMYDKILDGSFDGTI